MRKKDSKKKQKDSIFNYDEEVRDLTSRELDRIRKKKQKESRNKKKSIKKIKREQEKKVRNVRKRTPKEIKRINKTKKIAKFMGLIIVILTTIVLFLLSPIFNIKKIEISGNERITEQEIISLLNIKENTNLFKERTNEINKKLSQNAYISNVSINRKIPSTLQITIQERKVAYLLEYGESYIYIDSQGYILEISKENIEDIVKITGYETPEEDRIAGNRICNEDLDKLNTISQILKAAENNEILQFITAIDISNEDDFILFLDLEQKKVHLGNKLNLDIKMPYIKEIIHKESGVRGEIFVNMDLNTKKAYFRF